jgi:hypothetical protein
MQLGEWSEHAWSSFDFQIPVREKIKCYYNLIYTQSETIRSQKTINYSKLLDQVEDREIQAMTKTIAKIWIINIFSSDQVSVMFFTLT